jgi:hypothetical protein
MDANEKGEEQMRKGRLDNAIKLFDQAIESDNTVAFVFCNR